MFNNFINSFNKALSSGEQLVNIFRWLGIIFMIGFFVPYYNGRLEFFLTPTAFFNRQTMSEFTLLFCCYMPVVYGIILCVIPNYLEQKHFNIVLLCMSVIALFFLPAELHKTRFPFFEITSINLTGTLWLFVLSNCLLLVGISLPGFTFKFVTSKHLVIGGTLLFLLNAILPFQMYLRDFYVASIFNQNLFLAPFSLFKYKTVLTGIVLAAYLIFILIVIANALFYSKTGEAERRNIRLFVIAWLILIIGMLLAGIGDIMLIGQGPSSYTFPEIERESLAYIKSILYIIPLTGIVFLSIAGLFIEKAGNKEE
jgi:hypothetical protein